MNTFIFFIISFILLLILYYLYKYFNDEKYVMSGGGLDQSIEHKKILKTKIADRLTVVDDDIDVGILED